MDEQEIENFKGFFQAFCNLEGFPDPSGRSINGNLISYLPLGTTKESLYKQYCIEFMKYTTQRANTEDDYVAVRPIGFTTFR